jgi:hypothetical protein
MPGRVLNASRHRCSVEGYDRWYDHGREQRRSAFIRIRRLSGARGKARVAPIKQVPVTNTEQAWGCTLASRGMH